VKNIEYILVTVGLGCLGSHAVIKLLKKIKNIIVVDNLKNSKKKIISNLTRSIKTGKIFNVFGGNYRTKDGTCYRDYTHIDDLIDAHLSGLKYLNRRIYEVVNIGTGKCYSVKELISIFSKILNYDISYKIVGRREGDIPVCYASVKKSEKFLRWKTKKNILTMCKDIIKVI